MKSKLCWLFYFLLLYYGVFGQVEHTSVHDHISDGQLDEDLQGQIALLRENGLHGQVSVIMLQSAEALLHRGQLDDCIEMYNQTASQAHGVNDTIWASALIALATIHDMKGSLDLVRETLEPLLATQDVTPTNYISPRVLLADALIDNGNVNDARYYLDSAMAKVQEYPDSQALTAIHQTYGNCWFYLNEFDKSLEHYLKAIEAFPSYMSHTGKTNIHVNIGQLYYYLEEPDLAIQYANQGYNDAKRLGSRVSQYRALYVKGMALIFKDNINEGLVMLDSAYQAYSKYNQPLSLIRIQLGQVGGYIKLDSLQRATNILSQAKVLVQKVNSDKLFYSYYLAECDLALANNNLRQARLSLKDASQYLKEGKSSSVERSLLSREILLLKKMGQFEEALIKSDQLKKVDKQLMNLGKARIINEVQSKYDKVEDEKEILKLSLESKDQNLIIDSQRARLWSIGIVSLLALVFAYILFGQYKRIKRKNQIINTALSEKETLLREIHHRVKNNLQVISSLLYLQSETVKDEAALAALQEGRNRVKSMSLIHQNLYQGEDLVGVNTKTYFTKLVDSLWRSYKIDQQNISLEMDVESMTLDVDTLVPLALITNELISNSLKHAFNENEEGKVFLGFKERDGALILEQSDNGKGFDQTQINVEDSFGFQLIQLLGKKLDAQIDWEGNQGFTFVLKCPKDQKHE